MAKLLFKILIYDDAVNSDGAVEVTGPDERILPGRDLSEGIDDVVHIEHIEILTRKDKGVLALCVHKRCRLYC